MTDDDQLLKRYAQAVARREEMLSDLLNPSSSLDECRDAGIAYGVLGGVVDELERRAGFVRVDVEVLRRMDERISALAVALPSYASPTSAFGRAWAEFSDGVVFELRALIEDAS